MVFFCFSLQVLANMADAPVTPFVIPSHFESVFYNKPACKSVLVHSCPSSFKQAGIQAVLCFHSKPILPDHLGLPPMNNYEDTVFLQTSAEDQPFILQTDVASGQWMQINITEYLILLQYIEKEWIRLSLKLDHQLKAMREGTEPLYISGRLAFYNHGSSNFRTNLSSRLVFKAWIDSGDPRSIIHCCLEKKMENGQASEVMMLPMESLVKIAQDTNGMKAIVDIWTYYKSRIKN